MLGAAVPALQYERLALEENVYKIEEEFVRNCSRTTQQIERSESPNT